MKKTTFFTIGVLVLTIALFTSCDNGKETHTHEWGALQSDATQHWKECTANDGAKTDVANHTGNPCTVCGYETVSVPQPTPKTLTFGKVTISSPDEHLPSAWNALVDDVVSAFESAYEGASDTFDYDLVAKEGDGIQIVLQNDLAKNWEVKSGTKYGTLYIKTSSILSITAASYEIAMVSVTMNENWTSVN
jgi:hypothetical protein